MVPCGRWPCSVYRHNGCGPDPSACPYTPEIGHGNLPLYLWLVCRDRICNPAAEQPCPPEGVWMPQPVPCMWSYACTDMGFHSLQLKARCSLIRNIHCMILPCRGHTTEMKTVIMKVDDCLRKGCKGVLTLLNELWRDEITQGSFAVVEKIIRHPLAFEPISFALQVEK